MIMSMRKTIDKAMTTLENGTSGMVRFYRFMKGLTFRSKASADFQIKSNKRLHPLCRCGFNCDKEIKILPVIYIAMAMLFLVSLCCSSKKECDD